MSVNYSDNQKALIMLGSDLLDGSLTIAEKQALSLALDATEGDAYSALEMLSPETIAKANGILEKGLKLSLELGKLNQRGISVLFPGDIQFERFDEVFTYKPAMLFSAGDQGLLEQSDMAVVSSLSEFKKLGCTGVLLSDRAFDALLRDRQVASAIRERRALLVSDLLYARASTRKGALSKGWRKQADVVEQPSKRVFISGSRTQALIPKSVQESLEAIIEQRICVLIGDSDKGVDREIIDFLRAPLYENVTIFTISKTPRVAAEDTWDVRVVEADSSLKPQQRQMAKDRVMADEADWGLALFNPVEKNRFGTLQVSSGTLRNTVQMLTNGKMVKFFYLYEGEMACRNLKSLKDLENVIESYRSERLSEAERRTILSSKGVSQDDDAPMVKTRVILAKYNALRKSEETNLATKDSANDLHEPVQGVLPLFD